MTNRSYILLLFIITHLEGESQNVAEDNTIRSCGDYKLRVEAPMYECTIIGVITDSTLMVAEPGSVFTVINITVGDSAIIRFWEWKENTVLNYRLCYADSLSLKRKYFIVAKTDFEDRVVERFDRNPGFTAGTILIPFKLRLQKFDFSKDLTLGSAAGVRFRLSHYSPDYVSIVAGTGITSVTIDANSTDSVATEATDVPALTPYVGFVFEIKRVLQAGVFCGWDYISHNDRVHFIYHGKTWISFGLGYSLMSANDDRASGKERKP